MRVSHCDYCSILCTHFREGNSGILLHIKERIKKVASSIFSCECNCQTFTQFCKIIFSPLFFTFYNVAVLTGILFPNISIQLQKCLIDFENNDFANSKDSHLLISTPRNRFKGDFFPDQDNTVNEGSIESHFDGDSSATSAYPDEHGSVDDIEEESKVECDLSTGFTFQPDNSAYSDASDDGDSIYI